MSFAAVAVGVGSAVAGAAVSSALAPSAPMTGNGSASQAADPFASQRGQYQTALNNLMANPSSITQNPGYDFNLQQGLNAVQGSQAAKGMLNSGNTLTALQQQGQGFASQEYWNQVQELNLLSGANVGSPGTAGQIQAQQQQQNQQSASALGNQVGGLVGQGINGLLQPSYQSGSNPFATDTSGYGAGANTYGFSSGVSDPSSGVSYGFTP